MIPLFDKTYCKFCKQELDPEDAKLGYHPACKEIIDKYGVNLSPDLYYSAYSLPSANIQVK